MNLNKREEPTFTHVSKKTTYATMCKKRPFYRKDLK